MVVEHAPAGRRGLFGSLVQIGFPLGLVTSSGVFALVTMMPEADFKAWGWRIPFMLSILLLGVGWFVRTRVPETPIFEEIKRRDKILKNPFVEAIFRSPRSFLVAVGLKISEVSWVYILTIFIVVYATSQLHLPRTLLLNAIFVAALVEVITIPLFGWLSDHIGRRIFYFLGTFFTACFAFPLFWLLGTKDPLIIILTVVIALTWISHTIFAQLSGSAGVFIWSSLRVRDPGVARRGKKRVCSGAAGSSEERSLGGPRGWCRSCDALRRRVSAG